MNQSPAFLRDLYRDVHRFMERGYLQRVDVNRSHELIGGEQEQESLLHSTFWLQPVPSRDRIGGLDHLAFPDYFPIDVGEDAAVAAGGGFGT